ncbi:MAG: MerR family transcriptional regulator, partial [Pseudorhodobacter sp.]
MDKSPDAFRTISEVAEHLDTPAHVLRFWESRFPQIKPVKRAGGRRYYRPADVALLSGIKKLLHDEGLTIRGVQKILREQGVKHVSDMSDFELVESPDAEIALDVVADAEPEPAVSTDPIPLFPKPSPETPAADRTIAEDADTPEKAADLSPDEPEADASQAPEALPEAGMASVPDTPEESPAKIDAPEAEPMAAEPDVIADELAQDEGIDEAALMAALSDPVESISSEVDEDTALSEALQSAEPLPEPEAPHAEASDGAAEAPEFPFDSPPVPAVSD